MSFVSGKIEDKAVDIYVLKRAFISTHPGSEDLFEKTKVLAANQGLYNGFLSAGLLWSLAISDENWSQNIALFFLCCVSVAGIFGAYSASKKIFYVQALPAIIAIITIVFL